MASADRGVPAGQPPAPERFQKVTLDDEPGEPMSLAVLPDSRVLYSARTGEVFMNDPLTGLSTLVADFKDHPGGLYLHDEEGVQGIAVDPQFRRNGWVYVYYSPAMDTPQDDPESPLVNEGDAPEWGTPEDFAAFRGPLRLSRFKLVDRADDPATPAREYGWELDFDSEQQIIDVTQDRGICCHVGGQIAFDGRGNLYLSTGDDTNPFASEGYAPLDDRVRVNEEGEREYRNPAFDARRTSANTNDLRGKVLRIRVRPGGGYAIPEGNMFRPGQARTRPEIYAMGFRNPFRFEVNRETGEVYVADYSPDAPDADPARGPAGHGRWINVTRPANFGWPFCVTPTIPYRDYDFETEQSGPYFTCNRPLNDSRWNVDTRVGDTVLTSAGRRYAPPVAWPQVWYSYDESPFFPELGPTEVVPPEQSPNGTAVGGDGIGPMAGPAYHFAGRNPSRIKWPSYYDDAVLFYEWSRDIIREFRLDRRGGLADIREFGYTGIVDNPMDMEFGPDGALYVLEYGDGFFSENPDAQLSRIDFVRGNRSPEVDVSADPEGGLAPLTVAFTSDVIDADGDRLRYAWDFDADGVVDSTEEDPTFTYAENGVYRATLRVEDQTGRWAASSVEVRVGNAAPVVTLTVEPVDGSFDYGEPVTFTVDVQDDQPVDCARITVSYILGHDQHGHPQSGSAGCSGQINVPPLDSAHAQDPDVAAVFVATYADDPPEGEESLQGSAQVVLRPDADEEPEPTP
nr:PQQ-dependent sugar dehydrogenase [Vallicoccus soli]